MLDQAFESLKNYDWGADRTQLAPIDEAVRDAQGAARAELESRLTAALQTDLSRAAKDFLCRTLMQVGSAASAPVLGSLLGQADLAHMARFALERMPAPEAGSALRDALTAVQGPLLVGVIGSLGARRDAASVPALAKLVNHDDSSVARAAAIALGHIGNADAARALAGANHSSADVQQAVADARLAVAERLLSAGDKSAALAIYKALSGQDRPKHVRLAGTRGVLACAGKSQ